MRATLRKLGFPFLICLSLCGQSTSQPVDSSLGWKQIPRRVCRDEKAIWASPFHPSRAQAKWWLGLGAATGALIATDKWTAKQLPNTSDQVLVSRRVSRIGAVYTILPVTGALYLTGSLKHDERLRETGLLGVETLANTFAVVTVIKAATQRERPTEGDGTGEFWKGGGRFWNEGASFPSGHAIHAWALASLVAHRYPRSRLTPVVSYSLAALVSGSRFTARKHFAADVVAGSAMGYFIGEYVARKSHGGARRSWLDRVIAHVNFGVGF